MGQWATADTWFRTCRTSSFCTVAWQLARFQLTPRIARSPGDSWASCYLVLSAVKWVHWLIVRDRTGGPSTASIASFIRIYSYTRSAPLSRLSVTVWFYCGFNESIDSPHQSAHIADKTAEITFATASICSGILTCGDPVLYRFAVNILKFIVNFCQPNTTRLELLNEKVSVKRGLQLITEPRFLEASLSHWLHSNGAAR